MKKYFIKSVVVFLFTAVFFMASGFCFHGLLGLTFNEAKAATSENIIVNESDACVDTQNTEQKEIKEPVVPVKTSHQNSLLPCCVSEAHPSVISSVLQMSEITKFIPAVIVSDHLENRLFFVSKVYHEPIILPPELLALRSTILRI